MSQSKRAGEDVASAKRQLAGYFRCGLSALSEPINNSAGKVALMYSARS